MSSFAAAFNNYVTLIIYTVKSALHGKLFLHLTELLQ
jgi:hypothetical protein